MNLPNSFAHTTTRRRASMSDGVSRRLPSDGNDERVFRILVENGINIHAEVIPRSRFKKMVEGASRTAFSCSFFAHRQIVYSQDASIDSWFKKATRGTWNRPASGWSAKGYCKNSPRRSS